MNKTLDWNTGDDLGDLSGKKQVDRPSTPFSDAAAIKGSFVNVQTGKRQTYTDKCDKCRGSGIFYGYSGRAMGSCFKCKGTGKIEYKSTPAERQHAKNVRDDRKARKVVEAYVKLEKEHPAEHAWLVANTEKSPFARSLFDAVAKFGSLTEGQLNAVTKAVARDAESKAAAQDRIDNAKWIDVSKIERAFETARKNAKDLGALGIKWLTLRLDTFKFVDAPASGKWSAAILVREGDAKLGRIVGGKFIRNSFACDDPTEARVLTVAADPAAAAIAYGMKYSACSICGLELTNPESIKRGIGPICAAKFGW